MRSRRLKFKQLWHFVAAVSSVGLALAALSGCATMTTGSGKQAQAGPPDRLTVATPTTDHDVLAQLLDAQFAIDHNDLASAAKSYARAAALSEDPAVAERAAELAIATHDEAGAHQAIRRWAELGASDVELAGIRAKLALATGDTAGARKHLQALVTSGDQNVWRRFGQLLMGARDPAQAGQLLSTIATPQQLPSDPAAWLAMSEMGLKLGQHAYARKMADAAVERFHCADCYAWSAQLKLKAGHEKAARALYAEAVRKAPESTRLRLGYAALLAKMGNNAKAARILAKGSQDAATYQARVAFAARAKDMDELKRIYGDLRQAPESIRSQSYYLLGQLAGILDKPDAALDWFDKVPRGSKHRFDADWRSAVLWHQRGNDDKAHAMATRMAMDYADHPKQLRKAIELDAGLYMGEGKFAKAVDSYSRALKVAPNDPGLLYGRGLAYAESGNIDAAVADLRHVLKIKPNDVNALNALGFTLADAGRNLDEAESLIAQARKARPDDPAITDSWGWVQYRLGHLDAACKALSEAWKARQDPEVGAHLAEVLWQRGDRDKARRVLAAARKLAPHNADLQALAKKFVP